MATGDICGVRTVIITEFMTQGYLPLKAAIFGVYLEVRSEEVAMEKTRYHALTASSLIERVERTFVDLFEVPEALKVQGE